jgi:quercetin dioxygenase-like cupin family protein
MAMSGQTLSRDRQSRLQPFEQAPRPMVGYVCDYAPGHETGLHRHPRAQLLFATTGVMRVTTEAALFTVPPGTGLWVPADTLHGVRMDGAVRMRALFLRADAAASGPAATTVIALSPLLRELILTVCGEPVVWDARGPIRLVAALVLHEIRRAGTRPLSLPACRDARLVRVAAAVAHDRGVGSDRPRRAPGPGGGRRRICQRAGVRRGVSRDVRNHPGDGRAKGWFGNWLKHDRVGRNVQGL